MDVSDDEKQIKASLTFSQQRKSDVDRTINQFLGIYLDLRYNLQALQSNTVRIVVERGIVSIFRNSFSG